MGWAEPWESNWAYNVGDDGANAGGVQVPSLQQQNSYLAGVLGASGAVMGGIWKETVLRFVPTNLHPKERD